MSATGALQLFKGAKSGGLQFYDNRFVCYRCQKLKLFNKLKENDKFVPQDINIDGEDLSFSKFASYTVLP